MKFIDSFRFILATLSTLTDNHLQKIYEKKIVNRKCFVLYEKVENTFLIYSCEKCEIYYDIKFVEKSKH